ncbi:MULTISPECIES: hypothetical protein [Bacillus subtilis group]|uniref:hypothetical protein n=1 Tax=Bacillus subtilis group TaxID=653685 RepID=UPI0011A873E7|nr:MULTISPECIES: hypothetical protein [Bacillus subtilis group]MBA1162689.1 hypothetical protein [Bacillus licheniformis]MBW7635751.1 hypothetical protein [Bacillus licheniformis]MEC1022883.1 hypothetical protein [Bacillus paralicheniformis]MEC1026509.1 hypothetical protein [Bacillus paralicheniformis]MEC1036948.1 hypothetical protein [Bacillus paralicheniformis]
MGQPKNTIQTFRNPGEGAVQFAAEFVENQTRESALPIINSLLKGDLHDPTDKRIKKCAYCGYYYKDRTKPNNSKTCSKGCKTDLDTLRRAMKRADEALLDPKKKESGSIDSAYIWWVEYPFWLSEREMLKRAWKYEHLATDKEIEIMLAAKYRDQQIGGKRKAKCTVPYNGDEVGRF